MPESQNPHNLETAPQRDYATELGLVDGKFEVARSGDKPNDTEGWFIKGTTVEKNEDGTERILVHLTNPANAARGLPSEKARTPLEKLYSWQPVNEADNADTIPNERLRELRLEGLQDAHERLEKAPQMVKDAGEAAITGEVEIVEPDPVSMESEERKNRRKAEEMFDALSRSLGFVDNPNYTNRQRNDILGSYIGKGIEQTTAVDPRLTLVFSGAVLGATRDKIMGADVFRYEIDPIVKKIAGDNEKVKQWLGGLMNASYDMHAATDLASRYPEEAEKALIARESYANGLEQAAGNVDKIIPGLEPSVIEDIRTLLLSTACGASVDQTRNRRMRALNKHLFEK